MNVRLLSLGRVDIEDTHTILLLGMLPENFVLDWRSQRGQTLVIHNIDGIVLLAVLITAIFISVHCRVF